MHRDVYWPHRLVWEETLSRGKWQRTSLFGSTLNSEQVEWKCRIYFTPQSISPLKAVSIKPAVFAPSCLQDLVFTLGLNVSRTAPIMDEFLFSSLSSSPPPHPSSPTDSNHYLMHFSTVALLLINTSGRRSETAGLQLWTWTRAFVSYFVRITAHRARLSARQGTGSVTVRSIELQQINLESFFFSVWLWFLMGMNLVGIILVCRLYQCWH